MSGIYGALAPIYDKWQADVDYNKWADFFSSAFKRYFDGEVKDILDLGCGTASMTVALSKRSFDMIGVDNSPEMLSLARQRIDEAGLSEKILLLCQDIREFELYGTVEATVSSLDCINHLLNTKDVKKCFSLVHNYLVPNGIFIFDVNTKYKFENIYADNSFVFEDEGAMCVWQNSYNEKNHLCDFYISLFTENEDGSYEREDEYQRERMYPISTLKRLLNEAGFETLGIFGSFDFEELKSDDERAYIIARAIK